MLIFKQRAFLALSLLSANSASVLSLQFFFQDLIEQDACCQQACDDSPTGLPGDGCCYGAAVSYRRSGPNRAKCVCFRTAGEVEVTELSGTCPSSNDIREKSGAKLFACIGSRQIIEISRVNDDFCDCLDGSDEPGTSACSGIGQAEFLCHNNPSLISSDGALVPGAPHWIPSSRVNDGLCDCCDGSDEGEGICPDNCAELAAMAAASAAARAELVREGLARKAVMEKQAEELLGELDSLDRSLDILVEDTRGKLLEPLQTFIRGEDKKRNAYNREQLLEWARVESRRWRLRDGSQEEEQEKSQDGDHDHLDQNEEQVKEDGHDNSLFSWPSVELDSFRQVRRALTDVLKMTVSLGTSHEEHANPRFQVSLERFLEARQEILRKDRIPLASRSVKERRRNTLLAPILDANGAKWGVLLRHVVEAFGVVASPVRIAYECTAYLFSLAANAPGLSSLWTSVFQGPILWRTILSASAPARAWAARNNVRSLFYIFWDAGPTLYFYMFRSSQFKSKDGDNFQTILMRALLEESEAFLKSIAKAKKSVSERKSADLGPHSSKGMLMLVNQCFSKDLQGYKWEFCPFSSAKQGATLVGKFKKMASPTKMLLEDGQKCWNGPKRSINVTLVCGLENDIMVVEEPSVCSYTMDFGTPLAC